MVDTYIQKLDRKRDETQYFKCINNFGAILKYLNVVMSKSHKIYIIIILIFLIFYFCKFDLWC